jgi:hypothetical protein
MFSYSVKYTEDLKGDRKWIQNYWKSLH